MFSNQLVEDGNGAAHAKFRVELRACPVAEPQRIHLGAEVLNSVLLGEKFVGRQVVFVQVVAQHSDNDVAHVQVVFDNFNDALVKNRR